MTTVFYGGFAFLPWLWIVNYLLFWRDLTRHSTPEAVKWCIRIYQMPFIFSFDLISLLILTE
jgi:hypothetical protein